MVEAGFRAQDLGYRVWGSRGLGVRDFRCSPEAKWCLVIRGLHQGGSGPLAGPLHYKWPTSHSFS